MEKHLAKILTAVALLAVTAIVLIIYEPASISNAGIPPLSIPVPTPTPSIPGVSELLSPDGKATLILKKTAGEDTVKHDFLISNNDSESQLSILSRDVDKDSSMTIPFNTFSPDNKYFFLKESGPSGMSYFVFSSSGKKLTETGDMLEVSGRFYKQFPEYKITDITGWGGTTLLIVNTDTLDGKTGPSFWFDLSNQSFIKLSTRFN